MVSRESKQYNMEVFTLARVVHLLGVIIWIGGVAMVTTVIIPSVKKLKSRKDRIDWFETIEGRFSLHAKVATVLTGLSGFYMLYLLDAWDRYLMVRYWWVHAMTLVWFLFTMVLFVLEPFVLRRLFRQYAEQNPEKTFGFIHRAHKVLLLLSLITIVGAAAGSHGWFWFE